jgi:Endoribonuclease L-PSP
MSETTDAYSLKKRFFLGQTAFSLGTIDNLSAILEADGASLHDVVKVNAYLSDTSLFARYNAVYARRFSRPYPVRTTVGSDLGHTSGMLIEIDCVAYSLKTTPSRPKHASKKKAGRRGK